MTGYIRKYHAETKDPYLCDDGKLADPDFFTNQANGRNPIPTWAICGPYVRNKLKKNDIVFFVPEMKRLRRIGLDFYICTGMLVVDEIPEDDSAFLRHPSINAKFKRLYTQDLKDHLSNDEEKHKRRTKAIRAKRVVLGDTSRSMWFGKNDLDLTHELKRLGLVELSRQIRNRQVRTMTQEEALKLSRFLIANLDPIHDRTHTHLNRKSDGECKTCYRS